MKNFISYILAFYILLSATVPCSVMDGCEEEEQTEQSASADHTKDCNNCSPFSTCSSAGFTLTAINTALVPIEFDGSPVYSEYSFFSNSGYYSRPFQPPRWS